MSKFAILCALLAATHSSLAQAGASSPTPRADLKSPELARRYAWYFSGAGHFYTGDTPRALLLTGGSAVALYKFASALGCGPSYIENDCSGGAPIMWLAVLGAAYTYGIIDAPKSAERVNTRLRTSAPIPTVTVDRNSLGRLRLHAGLRVAIPNR